MAHPTQSLCTLRARRRRRPRNTRYRAPATAYPDRSLTGRTTPAFLAHKQAMVLKPDSRMGPPPRSFAADAHDCIMVRSLRTYRIQGCGAMIRARWQAPLWPSSRLQPACPPCSGLSRRGLETTERAARAERRPPLTGPVRVGLNTCVGRGEETGFQVEQRNWNGGSGEWCKIYA